LKILITNDDGIEAPGIEALAQSLAEIGEITVIAPLKEQSAIGHAITMQLPLRVTEYKKNGDLFGYAVSGTPADCVKIGIRNLMSEPPDLVVSGINHGSNTAINIIYSGTVSAAREAAIMDIPSMAVSVTNHAASDFRFAAKVSRLLAERLAGKDLPLGTLLNVNVPDIPEEQIAGIKLTRQGKSKWDDIYERRIDPYGKNYYWLKGNLMEVDTEIETDQVAIRKNYVSVSPIHFDLTDYETFKKMKNWKIENLLNGKKH
jgi:5'-nucleotidase